MRRGYIRHTRDFTAGEQEAILKAAGVTERGFYRDGQLESCIKSLRSGDVLEVVGLRALGSKRKVIADIVDKIHDRGAAAMDAATKRRSDGRDAIRLMDEAVAALANERRGTPGTVAYENGMKGAKASAASRAKGRMPVKMIETWWFDKTLQNHEVMARVNGDPNYPKPWAQTTLYRHLGPREVPAGRPTPRKTLKHAIRRQQERLRAGAVYFIRAAGGKGPVKIGFSNNPDGRMKHLQTSHHTQLEVIAAIEGTHEDEQKLHKRFKLLRLKGEWFRFHGPLKAYVATLPSYLKEK